jgi:hypothetical protein
VAALAEDLVVTCRCDVRDQRRALKTARQLRPSLSDGQAVLFFGSDAPPVGCWTKGACISQKCKPMPKLIAWE